jgi:hypothetical protein
MIEDPAFENKGEQSKHQAFFHRLPADCKQALKVCLVHRLSRAMHRLADFNPVCLVNRGAAASSSSHTPSDIRESVRGCAADAPVLAEGDEVWLNSWSFSCRLESIDAEGGEGDSSVEIIILAHKIPESSICSLAVLSNCGSAKAETK